MAWCVSCNKFSREGGQASCDSAKNDSALFIWVNGPSLLFSISQDFKTYVTTSEAREPEDVSALVGREFLRLSTIPKYLPSSTPSRFKTLGFNRASSLS